MITVDFIKNYIFDNYNDVKACKVIKKNNKYIGKILKTNPRFDREGYRLYTKSKEADIADFIFLGFFYSLILLITGVLCVIPHIVGVLLFTIINIILVTLFVQSFNVYDKIICVVIAICLFLITIFIVHHILIVDVSNSHNVKNVVERYKAFHTIYPEYLFKFKFK